MPTFGEKYRKDTYQPTFGERYRKGSEYQVKRPEAEPKSEYTKFKEEHPVISAVGGFQEKIINPIVSGIKNVVTHPIETIGGIGVGATETVMSAASNILDAESYIIKNIPKPVLDYAINRASSYIPTKEGKEETKKVLGIAADVLPSAISGESDYINRNRKAIEQIFDTNMEVRDAETAGAVGEFVGKMVPYAAASAITAGAVMPAASSALSGAGGLTLSQASTIGKIVNVSSNVLIDSAFGQLLIDPESSKDERVRQLATDVISTGVLESIGILSNVIKDKNTVKKITNFNSGIKLGSISIDEIPSQIEDINKSVELETGKNVDGLIQERIAKAVESGNINDINLSLSGVDVIPTKYADNVIKVPSNQLPVGTGELRTSGLADRIIKDLESVTPEDRALIPEFNKLVKKDELSWADKFVRNNYDDAISILEGKKDVPSGHLYNSLYVAMNKQAKGNPNLALQLASLRSSRYGQEIGILSEIDPHSPTKFINNLSRNRIEAIGGKEALDNLVKVDKKEVIRNITKNNLVKSDWNSFIESISC